MLIGAGIWLGNLQAGYNELKRGEVYYHGQAGSPAEGK